MDTKVAKPSRSPKPPTTSSNTHTSTPHTTFGRRPNQPFYLSLSKSTHTSVSVLKRPLTVFSYSAIATDWIFSVASWGNKPGNKPHSPEAEAMTSLPGNVPQTPESRGTGGIASVFRGLTSGRHRSPPPQKPSSTSTPLFPLDATLAAESNEQQRQQPEPQELPNPNLLSPTHMEFFENLKTGSINDRVSAANSLRYALEDYASGCVLDVWEAGKDLIDASQPITARAAGWELLTECVKHQDSSDLERKEYFQTISKAANPDDFHLQLAALVDLTNRGRKLSGFDYDVIPLLTDWLKTTSTAVTTARKASKANKGKTAPVSGEEKNLAQLFAFIGDVIKFSSNVAKEDAIGALVETVLNICMSTSHEEDLTACIAVINAIVTFDSIPEAKLKQCIVVLSSIYCLVPALDKVAWHTISIVCRSHNGQATVQLLLGLLRHLPKEGGRSQSFREARGAMKVLQKLLCKTTEKGYPPVPFSMLLEGLAAVVKASTSTTMRLAVLSVINTLFDTGSQRPHPMLVDEDWSELLGVATTCFANVPTPEDPGLDSTRQLHEELLVVISHVEYFLESNSSASDFLQRHNCIAFLQKMCPFLPDSGASIIMDYFTEFRCCMPSDPDWKQNLQLVTTSFLRNRKYEASTRLKAMAVVKESYEMVEVVDDLLDDDTTTQFARSVLAEMNDETDVEVLRDALDLVVSMAVAAPMPLFELILEGLRGIINSDRLRAPAPISACPDKGDKAVKTVAHSPSNIVTSAFVRIFMQCMHENGPKSVRIYDLLVGISKSKTSETDARLTAMKLLFRLRADWARQIFLVDSTNSGRMAEYLYRTEPSFTKRQAEEEALRSRPGARALRGTSGGAQGESGAREATAKYQQTWMLPDPQALPIPIPVDGKSSPILLSHIGEDEAVHANSKNQVALNLASWLDAVVHLVQRGTDWEVYSFILVHLPSQLGNQTLFRGATPKIRDLRKVVCEQIKGSSFQEPPDVIGLRRSDVALCLFQLLTTVISYHGNFEKKAEEEIVTAFVHGLHLWDRSYRACIHALSVCCHEMPMSLSKALVPILTRMAQIISQPAVSIHILEFLACLSRLPRLYANFREEEYRVVFGICFRYLQSVRDKRASQRISASVPPTPMGGATPAAPAHLNGLEGSVSPNSSEDLPQYVYALAYHVITFWFLAIRVPDRASYVHTIAKQLFSDVDGSQMIEEQAETTMDFMQRVAYGDVEESKDDPLFTEDRFKPIVSKTWIVAQSVVTIKQSTSTGWTQVTKRQPSGTSYFTIRENFRPPPPHQDPGLAATNNEGRNSSHIEVLPSHVMVHLLNMAPQPETLLRPIALPDDDQVKRSLRLFDMASTVDGHKVGVIYIDKGQTRETEILANVSGSPEYNRFLQGLGTLTRLKGADFNTQGLDRVSDTDGKYTFCWRDKVTEIVYHVTTQMPTNLDHDAQCILKKRHIGNDFVNIVFNDSGLPFKFDTFPGDFNFVKIVITPESRSSFTASRLKSEKEIQQSVYKVHVISKPGFPEISPASEPKMVTLDVLPGFVRLIALNASVFSNVWANRDGGDQTSPWRQRLREVKRLREKYGPKTGGMIPAGGPVNAGGIPGQGHWAGAPSAVSTNSASSSTMAGTPGLGSASTPVLNAPSPPGTSLGVDGHHHHPNHQQQQNPHHGISSYPHASAHAHHSRASTASSFDPNSTSTFRNSIGSFRRSSIATFWTGGTGTDGTSGTTAGGASHRSSVVTDGIGYGNGEGQGEGVVDMVDFSRWA